MDDASVNQQKGLLLSCCDRIFQCSLSHCLEGLLADTWSLSCGPHTTEVVVVSPGAL